MLEKFFEGELITHNTSMMEGVLQLNNVLILTSCKNISVSFQYILYEWQLTTVVIFIFNLHLARST